MIRKKIEQETTITFNAIDPFALIGSSYPPMLKKLKSMNLELHRNDGEWITYKIDKKLIGIRKKMVKRILTEDQKHIARQRLKSNLCRI